jgi:hypothetical protein
LVLDLVPESEKEIMLLPRGHLSGPNVTPRVRFSQLRPRVSRQHAWRCTRDME